MSYRAEFGALVRKHRKDKHYSLERLAELCNVSDRSIGNIERGYQIPGLARCSNCAEHAVSIPDWLTYLNVDEDSHDDDSMLLTR